MINVDICLVERSLIKAINYRIFTVCIQTERPEQIV